jgi:hypothetical protein
MKRNYGGTGKQNHVKRKKETKTTITEKQKKQLCNDVHCVCSRCHNSYYMAQTWKRTTEPCQETEESPLIGKADRKLFCGLKDERRIK